MAFEDTNSLEFSLTFSDAKNTLSNIFLNSFKAAENYSNKFYDNITKRFNGFFNFLKKGFNLFTGIGAGLSIFDAFSDFTKTQDAYFAKLYQMGNNASLSLALADQSFLQLKKTAAETGLSFEDLSKTALNVLDMYLVKNTKDAIALSKQIEATAKITNISNDALLNLNEAMLKYNKNLNYSLQDTKKMSENLVAFQRATQLSAKDMTTLTNDMAEMMKKAGGAFDKSKVDTFGKSVLNLGGYFAKIRLDISKAKQLVDSFIDPLKMEENLALLTKMGYTTAEILKGEIGTPEKLGMGLENFAKEIDQIAKTNRFAAAQMAKEFTGGQFTLDEMQKIAKSGYSAFMKEKELKKPKEPEDLFKDYLKDRNSTVAQKLEIIKNQLSYIFSLLFVTFAPVFIRLQEFVVSLLYKFIPYLTHFLNWFSDLNTWKKIFVIGLGALGYFVLLPLLGTFLKSLINILVAPIINIFKTGIMGIGGFLGKLIGAEKTKGGLGSSLEEKTEEGLSTATSTLEKQASGLEEKTSKTDWAKWAQTMASVVIYAATILGFLWGLTKVLPPLAAGIKEFKNITWEDLAKVGAVVGVAAGITGIFSLLGSKGGIVKAASTALNMAVVVGTIYALGFALGSFAKAAGIKEFKNITWEDLAKVGAVVGVAAGITGIFSLLGSKGGIVKAALTALNMAVVVGTIYALGFALGSFAKGIINFPDWAVLGRVGAVIGIAMGLTSVLGLVAVSGIGAVAAIGGAVLSLATIGSIALNIQILGKALGAFSSNLLNFPSKTIIDNIFYFLWNFFPFMVAVSASSILLMVGTLGIFMFSQGFKEFTNTLEFAKKFSVADFKEMEEKVASMQNVLNTFAGVTEMAGKFEQSFSKFGKFGEGLGKIFDTIGGAFNTAVKSIGQISQAISTEAIALSFKGLSNALNTFNIDDINKFEKLSNSLSSIGNNFSSSNIKENLKSLENLLKNKEVVKALSVIDTNFNANLIKKVENNTQLKNLLNENVDLSKKSGDLKDTNDILKKIFILVQQYISAQGIKA